MKKRLRCDVKWFPRRAPYLACGLPARTMYRCHRLTEQRIHAILDGRKQPHDVEIV